MEEEKEKEIRKHLKDVNYNMNQKMKVMEKKIDDIVKLVEKTMNTWVVIVREMKDEQKKIETHLMNIERDVKSIKAKRVVQNESVSSNTDLNRKLEENEEDEDDIGLDITNEPPPILMKTLSGLSLSNLTTNNNTTNNENKREKTTVRRTVQRKTLNEKDMTQQPQIDHSPTPDNLSLVVFNPNQQSTTYRDLKIEKFDIPVEFIIKCLEMNNIGGDIKLFKRMYIEGVPKEYYPIRHIGKRFQYWLNGKMNDDANGVYIKNTIIKNIEKLYYRVNIIDNYKNKHEQFMMNQDYLSRITDEKNKERFLSQIVSIIDI